MKIILSDASPVNIDVTLWPTIAEASWHDSAIECQATEVHQIVVREHADGRRLVYGGRDSGPGGCREGFRAVAAGYLVVAVVEGHEDEERELLDEKTIRAIRRVAGVIDHDQLAAECIANLPPRDI